MDSLHNDIQQVFRDVFCDKDLIIKDSSTACDIDGWDSLNHINLIIALEKRLGVKFSTAEISRLKEDGENVGTLVAMVRRKRG